MTAYYWGDEIGKGNANCKECGSQWDDKQTSPVGSFAANQFGLYDMAGNIGNGCKIVITATTTVRLRTVWRGPVEIAATVSSAAVPSTTFRRTSARPPADWGTTTSGATAWASVSGGRCYPLNLYLLIPWVQGEAVAKIFEAMAPVTDNSSARVRRSRRTSVPDVACADAHALHASRAERSALDMGGGNSRSVPPPSSAAWKSWRCRHRMTWQSRLMFRRP